MGYSRLHITPLSLLERSLALALTHPRSDAKLSSLLLSSVLLSSYEWGVDCDLEGGLHFQQYQLREIENFF